VSDLTLFDAPAHPRARARDTQTALDAARSITPGRTERMILDLFHGPGCALVQMTDDELAAFLPLLHSPTVKSARSRLTALGLLEDSGVRRPSDRGRDQIVWRLT
jgi:hypothetical protein